jgi:polyisoprenoid-binding protein YceI
MKKIIPLTIVGSIALAGLSVLAGLGPRTEAPKALLNASAAGADAGNVDGVHSYIFFRIKHMNAGYSYGRFDDISGDVSINDAKLDKSSIALQVKTASVNTGNAKRDGHLKTNDFFAAAENPTATFKSKSIKKGAENTYDVTGDLTIRGTTKEVSFKLNKTGQAKGPQGEVAGYETTLTLNRLDYGVKFMPDMLGTEVQLTVSFEAKVN